MGNKGGAGEMEASDGDDGEGGGAGGARWRGSVVSLAAAAGRS